MEKTLGGERLGTGAKIKVDLHGWGRSTFNQSRGWKSTMACGTLVPCFKEVYLNGDTAEIEINTLAHTIPTIAPLFDQFKLQVDLFACPIRLYQGLLHNNAVNIGMEMNKVLFPMINVSNSEIDYEGATNPSSLNNYLGIKGAKQSQYKDALFHLAYYDIFKQYYSNKQEENAKVIVNTAEDFDLKINKTLIKYNDLSFEIEIPVTKEEDINKWDFNYSRNAGKEFKATFEFEELKNLKEVWLSTDSGFIGGDMYNLKKDQTVEAYLYQGLNFDANIIEENIGSITRKDNKIIFEITTYDTTIGNIRNLIIKNSTETKIKIQDFPLENIDKARRIILSKTDLNQQVIIEEMQVPNDEENEALINFLPYTSNVMGVVANRNGIELEEMNLQGLMLKTYLSDIYNSWLSTDYVDLINQISSITPNEQGLISMDSLILAKKVYNILNRIAVSGGTYEDWQEAQYGEDAIQRAESPIYIGGTSAEIQFEEVVSTASAQNAAGKNQPLATLGGKGVLNNRNGGKIVYKAKEPTIILGIVSITPRVNYSQGNYWFVNDIMSMDDLHKPGLDGIGFQNLMAEQIHWKANENHAYAKVPAWINYQTAVDEVFGNFAIENGKPNSLSYMVLDRNYKCNSYGEIEDFTTYIDPSKFNYAFAENKLDSQNFWVQLGFKVESRRKMAAYDMPNL